MCPYLCVFMNRYYKFCFQSGVAVVVNPTSCVVARSRVSTDYVQFTNMQLILKVNSESNNIINTQNIQTNVEPIEINNINVDQLQIPTELMNNNIVPEALPPVNNV